MSAYRITTESTADLDASIYKEYDISVIPLEYRVDSAEPQTDPLCAEGAFDLFNQMEQGAVVTTTLINQLQFEAFWTPILEQGEDILHIAFTNALSGTYNCAVLAMQELMERFPERHITIVDSCSVSGGQGLLAIHAAIQQKNGLDYAACCAFAEGAKRSVHHLFTVNDLCYLVRGGRLSKAAASIGSLLPIKPALEINSLGRLALREKVKGRLASIKWLKSRFMESFDPALNPFIIIAHANCQEDAERLRTMLHAEYPNLDIRFSFIGAIIGAHTGKGTLALFFRGSNRCS